MVRKWYLLVAAWLQTDRRLADLTAHLQRASALFPADATVRFMTGCLHEAFASTPVQNVIDSAPVPRNSFSIRSYSEELSLAESGFGRALSAQPDLAEARLRRARILALQGKHGEAALELRLIVASLADDRLLYYAYLFLGAEEEALGHREAARSAYQQASALFPRAQSPFLALCHLAWTSGETDAAIGNVQRLLDLQGDEIVRTDPWWTYDLTCGPDPAPLLAELRKPFLARSRN
jgi:tetratricopeptide (TPR) repeat protein